MIAAMGGRSSGAKPHEPALSGLHEGAFEPGSRQIEVGDRLALYFDASLGDQPPRLAGRSDPEILHEQGRQMERVAGGKRRLLHVVRRLVFAHHTREVLLPAPRSLLSVPPADDAACELELPLHGVLRMLAPVDEELPPL